MTLKFATTLRTARATAIVTALDAGSGAGKLLLYTEPQPAGGAAITTQTLIGTCVLSDPCGTVSNGVLTFAAIADDAMADATGLIAWARAVDSDDTFVLDMTAGILDVDNVTTIPANAELIFNTLSAQAGGVIQVLSGSITEGNM